MKTVIIITQTFIRHDESFNATSHHHEELLELAMHVHRDVSTLENCTCGISTTSAMYYNCKTSTVLSTVRTSTASTVWTKRACRCATLGLPTTSSKIWTCGISAVSTVCTRYPSLYHNKNNHHTDDELSLWHLLCSRHRNPWVPVSVARQTCPSSCQ